MSWEEAKEACPGDVIAACHNSNESVTVSGDADAVRKMVDDLSENGLFAKEVNTAGVAFHSPMMDVVKEPLLKKLRDVGLRSSLICICGVSWQTMSNCYCLILSIGMGRFVESSLK